MYIQGHEEEFRAFLAQNAAFWRENTGYPRDEKSCLYVDLSHDNAAYLTTNLWIAKYLQKVRGGRLIGLAHGWMKACPSYDFATVQELAHSFLIDEVVNLDAAVFEEGDEAERFASAVDGLSGADLRKAILGFDSDRDPDIGWILYDTWLRQERRGSIDRGSPDLLACARITFRARRAVTEAMRNGTTIGAVVGHYHYSPYSFMALEAVRQQAPVYFQSLLLPVSVRRFITESDVRRGRPSDFLCRYKKHVQARIGAGELERFARRMFEIQLGSREFFRAAPIEHGACSRREFLTGLGLNPELPVVCFYVPALCGAPHCFGPIAFDDLGEWAERSLEAAVQIANVNFLVKRHPQDDVYDTENLVGHLENIYGTAPNVRFLNAEIPAGQMAAVCDMVATVSGTPGYDIAVRGVATVAAGPSRYSGLGFALEPATFPQYRAILERAGEYQLTEEQRRNATLFAFFELAAGRSQSLFVPPARLAGTAEFWCEGIRRLRSCFLEEDPLYRNLSYMLDHDLPFLLNTDVAGWREEAPVAKHEEVSAALAGLHAANLASIRAAELRATAAERESARAVEDRTAALGLVASWIAGGQPVWFGQEQPGNQFLGKGWSVPEQGGVWTDGSAAVITLPGEIADALLCIECRAFTPAHSPVRRVELWCDGRTMGTREFDAAAGPQIWKTRVSATDPCRIELRIEKPAVPHDGGRRLGLWISRLWFETGEAKKDTPA